MGRGRIASDADFAESIARLAGRGRAPGRYGGTDGTAGVDADAAQLGTLEIPMDDVGQMLYGEEDGALAALAAPTAATQIVGAVGPDGDGKFRPAWKEETGGGSPPATGQYRHFVLTADGAGGWGFVTATIDGQTWPVTALAELE